MTTAPADKFAGAGFYNYLDGKRDLLWSGLRTEFVIDGSRTAPFEDLRDRFLFIQALETKKCFDEGVITSDADANIGSIFGIGFPAWSGGVRQFVTGYPGGRVAFLTRANELSAAYGPRFETSGQSRHEDSEVLQLDPRSDVFPGRVFAVWSPDDNGMDGGTNSVETAPRAERSLRLAITRSLCASCRPRR